MGGIAHRVGVKTLLVVGLAIQAIGMLALAAGSSLPVLIVFAIGAGGGYGTIFLATTLSLQEYFGRKNYAQIFGANQLFTTISVVGPAVAGWIADVTGRFDI
jgi:MFS family permease